MPMKPDLVISIRRLISFELSSALFISLPKYIYITTVLLKTIVFVLRLLT